jgi:hypothetical protein
MPELRVWIPEVWNSPVGWAPPVPLNPAESHPRAIDAARSALICCSTLREVWSVIM